MTMTVRSKAGIIPGCSRNSLGVPAIIDAVVDRGESSPPNPSLILVDRPSLISAERPLDLYVDDTTTSIPG